MKWSALPIYTSGMLLIEMLKQSYPAVCYPCCSASAKPEHFSLFLLSLYLYIKRSVEQNCREAILMKLWKQGKSEIAEGSRLPLTAA